MQSTMRETDAWRDLTSSVAQDLAGWDFRSSEDGESLDAETKALEELEVRQASHSSAGHPAFATEENLDESTAYLQAALRESGIATGLPLCDLLPRDAADVCNTVFTLLQRHQADAARQARGADTGARLRSDLGVASKARESLAAKLAERERQLGALQNQVRAAEAGHAREVARLTSERDEAARAAADLQRRRSQAEHEARRKERDFERLQGRLRDLLSEQKQQARANMAAAGQLRGSGPAAGRRDDELLKKIVAAYEGKQATALREAADLRAALASLQAEHRSLINQQVRQVHELASMRELVGGEEARVSGSGSEDGAGPLQDPQHLRQQLAERMSALSLRAAGLDADALLEEELETQAERHLHRQLQEARQLLQEQEQLTSAALRLRPTTRLEADAPGMSQDGDDGRDDGDVHALSNDIIATAEADEASDLQSSLAEERQRLEARQAELEAEKARLAAVTKAEYQRLQQEAYTLGAEKWEFENSRTAFQDTIRQFAPGFGAGRFLAKAIAKRSALAAVERGRELEGLQAAQQRAMHSVSLNALFEVEERVLGPRSGSPRGLPVPV